jgi:hypothetical protein
VPASTTPPTFYTVREIAKILKVSPDTAARKFRDFPGVIDIGEPETFSKRAYKVLRIPEQVLNKFLHENRVSA